MLSMADGKVDVSARVSAFDINCNQVVIYYDSLHKN